MAGTVTKVLQADIDRESYERLGEQGGIVLPLPGDTEQVLRIVINDDLRPVEDDTDSGRSFG